MRILFADFQKIQIKQIKPYLSGMILRNVESPLSCHCAQQELLTAQHFWKPGHLFRVLGAAARCCCCVTARQFRSPLDRNAVSPRALQRGVRAVGISIEKRCGTFLQKHQSHQCTLQASQLFTFCIFSFLRISSRSPSLTQSHIREVP